MPAQDTKVSESLQVYWKGMVIYMRGFGKFANKKIMVSFLTACVMLGMTGCGGSSASDKATMEAVTNGSYEYGVYEESMADSGSFMSGSGEKSVEVNESAAEESTSATANRKLIKTVDMNVETREFDMLLSTVESQVDELGGYIENMNTYNGSTYNDYRGTRNANLTIRIPKDKLDTFLNTVTGISNVIRRSDKVEDVTLTYVDLASHRDSLRTEQSRLLELLEKAETIEDIITIEQRLSNVRYQLESMESQLRTFDNQVDYSTVHLEIEEVEVFTPVQEETVWERIGNGFVDSLKSIGNSFVEFAIWFVVNLPFMVVWAIITIVVILVLRFVVKLVNKMDNKNKSKNQYYVSNGTPNSMRNNEQNNIHNNMQNNTQNNVQNQNFKSDNLNK